MMHNPAVNTRTLCQKAVQRRLLLTLGSSSCYVLFAFSPSHICGCSSIFCSGCALRALAVQRVFLLLYAGCWLASFGRGIIHGLRGMCFFSAPPPNRVGDG